MNTWCEILVHMWVYVMALHPSVCPSGVIKSELTLNCILETYKGRDLIFGTETPWIREILDSMWAPGGAGSMWAPGGATYMSETCFCHISGTNKARDFIFGTDVI